MSVDPITAKYPELTPYQFASNTPIQAVDLDGAESMFGWSIGLTPKQTAEASDSWNKHNAQIVKGSADGVGESLTNTWNFFTSNMWKAETWKNMGLLLEEGAMSMSTVKVTPTPRIDASVKSFENNVINGNGYTRSKFISGFVTDFVTAELGAKSFGALSKVPLTTSDGFLIRGFQVKAPFDIPVQRFGNMSLGKPDFWGLKIGANQFVNRTFAAILPEWNPLIQYTSGIIPKGEVFKFGLIGPQGWIYPGGSAQFMIKSSKVVKQSSKTIE